jgi:hypothetical protein
MTVGDQTGTDIAAAITALGIDENTTTEAIWRAIAREIIENRLVASKPTASGDPGEPGQIHWDGTGGELYVHTGSGWVKFSASTF